MTFSTLYAVLGSRSELDRPLGRVRASRHRLVDPAPGQAGPTLRRAGWATRMILWTAASLLVVTGVVVVAVVCGLEIDDRASAVASISETRRANAVAGAAISEVGVRVDTGIIGDPLDSAIRRATQRTAWLGAQTAPMSARPALRRVLEADGSALQAARSLLQSGAVTPSLADRARSTLATATDAHGALEARLARSERAERAWLRRWTRRQIIWSVTAGVLGIAALAVGCAALISSFVQPLRELGRVLRRFGNGDLDVRAGVAPDELGLFAQSFNRMADSLATQIRSQRDELDVLRRERLVAEAFEQASSVAEVFRVVEHGLALAAPARRGELLVRSGDQGELRQVATTVGHGGPGCPVARIGDCPSVHRGRTLLFSDPKAVNLCPFLASRPEQPPLAVCTPVAANGEFVGVVHVVSPFGADLDDLIGSVESLAAITGSRLASMQDADPEDVVNRPDELTGVSTRRVLGQRVNDLFRTSKPFVLVALDLDQFNLINTEHGHAVGDEVLRTIARVLSRRVRRDDTVARPGGDGFVVLCPDLSVRVAIDMVARLRNEFTSELLTRGLPVVSVSGAIVPSTYGNDLDSVLEGADGAIALAKQLGRNRVMSVDRDVMVEVLGPDSSSTAPADSGPLA